MSAEYPSSQETHLFSKTLTPLLFLHSPHNIPGDRETERDKAENNEFTCVQIPNFKNELTENVINRSR